MSKKPKIGVGVCLYNRPDYLEQVLAGIKDNLLPVIDSLWFYNDGSRASYKSVYKQMKGMNIHDVPKNRGVAIAKNWLLKKLYEENCDYLFLLEEDIVIDSPKAITEYVRLSQLSGIEHMMFAHHGEANVGMLYKSINGIDLYTASVGAWCMYTRNILDTVGYFDENMKNAFEHVEHTFRIQKAGLCPPYPLYADVTESRSYMHEIPGSIDNSSIRPRKDWQRNIAKALLYWKQKDPDFPLDEMLIKMGEA